MLATWISEAVHIQCHVVNTLFLPTSKFVCTVSKRTPSAFVEVNKVFKSILDSHLHVVQ